VFFIENKLCQFCFLSSFSLAPPHFFGNSGFFPVMGTFSIRMHESPPSALLGAFFFFFLESQPVRHLNVPFSFLGGFYFHLIFFCDRTPLESLQPPLWLFGLLFSVLPFGSRTVRRLLNSRDLVAGLFPSRLVFLLDEPLMTTVFPLLPGRAVFSLSVSFPLLFEGPLCCPVAGSSPTT